MYANDWVDARVVARRRAVEDLKADGGLLQPVVRARERPVDNVCQEPAQSRRLRQVSAVENPAELRPHVLRRDAISRRLGRRRHRARAASPVVSSPWLRGRTRLVNSSAQAQHPSRISGIRFRTGRAPRLASKPVADYLLPASQASRRSCAICSIEFAVWIPANQRPVNAIKGDAENWIMKC